MATVESRLPSIFYKTIDDITDAYWMKFVRLLGLAECDIQSVAGNEHGYQERKYQTLNRWKMYIGAVSDSEVEEILSKTRVEVNGGRPYNCSRYSDQMRERIRFARCIYQFVESYEETDWNRIARQKLNMRSPDMITIKAAYSGPIEKRYQMVLRWMQVEQIDLITAMQRLDEFHQHPLL